MLQQMIFAAEDTLFDRLGQAGRVGVQFGVIGCRARMSAKHTTCGSIWVLHEWTEPRTSANVLEIPVLRMGWSGQKGERRAISTRLTHVLGAVFEGTYCHCSRLKCKLLSFRC